MAQIASCLVLDKIEGEWLIEEHKVPEAGPDEMVIRIELTGVCGTDVHMYYGHLDTMKYPLLMGHEFCGIIESIGSQVMEDTVGRPVKLGDRIVVVPGATCGKCYYCKIIKTPTRCTNRRSYGFSVNSEDTRLTGGFGQYVHIKYANTSFFKTDLEPAIAVLTEPLSICVHGFVRSGGVPFGSTVLVQGTGAIGLGAIAFAKRAGAAKVIAIGGPSKRLELARQFGADITINIEEVRDSNERIRLVKEETKGKRGADVAIECAGIPAAIPEGLACLRDSAQYIELGHFTDVGTVPINPHHHILRKNVDLLGIWGSEVQAMEMTLSILERKELPYEELVTHILPMNRVGDSIHAMSKGGYRLSGSEDQILKAAIDPWLPL